MADENLDIKIKVKVIDNQLNALMAKLAVLEERTNKLSSGKRLQKYTNQASSAAASFATKWKKSFDFVDSAIKMTGKIMTKFLTLAIKGVIVEMALLSATMVGVHALFVAGQWLMKAYRGAMQLLAGAAAAAGVAIAAASAAIREQQAAMYAYRGKGAQQFGSAMNQTRMAMRNLQADASLAGLGIENLNKAFGVMSKTMNTTQINASGRAIRALMDFGSAGQDPAKSIEQVAEVVAALNDQKKTISDVISAAKKLGPEMEKALKSGKAKTKEQFREMLYSGDLAEAGGVKGQFDALNNTLIGVFKTYFTQIRTAFADYGDQYLEPLKVAFDKIFIAIRTNLAQISTVISYTIGEQGVVDGFTNTVTRLGNWLVKMMREYLPKAIGMFDRLSSWWDRFTRGWNIFFDKLRPLVDGARVIYKAFAPIWEAIKRGAENLTFFKDQLIDSEGTAIEFGERIGDIIDTISELFMNMKKIFQEIAPFINDLLSGLTQIVKLFSSILTSGAGSGFAKALAPLYAFNVFGRRMQSVTGRLMPTANVSKTATMNVTAQQVNVNGGPVGPGVASRVLSSGGAGDQAAAGEPSAPGAKSPFETEAGKQIVKKLADGKKGIGADGTYSRIFGREGAIMAGQMRATEMMDRAGSAAARQVHIDRARQELQQSLAKTQQIKNQIQQQAINAANPIVSPGLRAQIAADTPTKAPSNFGAYARYLGARGQMALKAGAESATYGVRSAIGGFGGFMDAMRGGGYDPEKREMTNPAAAREALRRHYRGFIEPDGTVREPTDPRGRFARRLGYMRDMMRLERTQTRGGMAMDRFAKSGTGRMGTSMGLSVLSQYAPEEMRGAMALGGTLSMIDPRLGLAVAGVGGAMKAKGVVSGALSGAMGGAAMGAIGGAPGVAIGAVLGGVFGAVSGAINRGKEEMKKARAAVNESFASFYKSFVEGANFRFKIASQTLERGGKLSGPAQFSRLGAEINKKRTSVQDFLLGQAGLNVNDLFEQTGASRGSDGMLNSRNASQALIRSLFQNQEKLGLSITADQLKEMLKSPEAALKEYGVSVTQATGSTYAPGATLEAEITEEEKRGMRARAKIDEVNNKRLQQLTKLSGKSGAEIEYMAKAIGVNLYDTTVDFNVIVEKLGLTMKKTSFEINDAITDIMLTAQNSFRQTRQQKEAILAIDSASEKLRDQLDATSSTTEQQDAVSSYFENYFDQVLAASGGDAKKAMLTTLGSFATPGQGAYGEGEVFEGKYDIINPIISPQLKEMRTGLNTELAGAVQGILNEAGFVGEIGMISSAIGGMDLKQLESLINYLNTNPNVSEYAGNMPQLLRLLSSVGFGGAATQSALGIQATPLDELNSLLEEKLGKMTEDERNAFKENQKEMNTIFDEFFRGKIPQNVHVVNWEQIRGDTSTPRGDTTSSKLSQTMARHASMNAQLTGKRSITSAYRNFGLGSINSDHVTGRAYDLTGQNLGQYKTLVERSGGFAEFHGTMASRHLHVVPARGDSATPAVAASVGSATTTSGGVTNYYNFEINGGNQSPEQIAKMVIAKIEERDRSQRERA